MLLFALVIVFLVNNRPPNIIVPTHKLPKDNGYDYFVRATKMIRGVGPMSSANKPPASWTVPELERFAHDNAPALSVLREGLGKQYLYPPVRSYNAIFPELATFRELARTMVGEAMYCDAIGDCGRSADTHLDCIEFGATLPRGGVLITALVGVAIEMIGAHDFGAVLPKLSRQEFAHVAMRLERIQARRVPFADIMQEEGYLCAAGWAEAMRSRDYLASTANPVNWFRYNNMFGIGPASSPGEVFDNARVAFANKTAFVRSLQDYYQAVAVEQRHRPYDGKSSVPAPQGALAQMWVLNVPHMRGALEKSAAIVALIQAEVALRRYRFGHGRYPDTLSALVPAYLKEEPIDPFGLGKPLRYKPLGEGRTFLLYSLGLNLKDDGGAPGSSSDGFQTGDIVAGKW
jgi:hypothetical protein